MSIQIKISKIEINKYESRSWMMIKTDISKSYTNMVEGLMGNFNSRGEDDLRSRSGEIISINSNDEKIYNSLVSCKMTHPPPLLSENFVKIS